MIAQEDIDGLISSKLNTANCCVSNLRKHKPTVKEELRGLFMYNKPLDVSKELALVQLLRPVSAKRNVWDRFVFTLPDGLRFDDFKDDVLNHGYVNLMGGKYDFSRLMLRDFIPIPTGRAGLFLASARNHLTPSIVCPRTYNGYEYVY